MADQTYCRFRQGGRPAYFVRSPRYEDFIGESVVRPLFLAGLFDNVPAGFKELSIPNQCFMKISTDTPITLTEQIPPRNLGDLS